MNSDYRIEPLTEQHNRRDFSCGVEPLDRYLQRQAGQDVRKRVAAVFVLTSDGKTIAGYYTLSAYVASLADLPAETVKTLPRYPVVPATLLGRLAVNTKARGQGIGEFLLMDAFRRVLASTRQVASAMIIVDAKDDIARNFYLHHGFIPFPASPNRLFYPVATIEKLVSGG